MQKSDPFIEIRPYKDEELPMAINRLLKNKGFISSLVNFIPEIPLNILIKKIKRVETIQEFQTEIFVPICKNLIERSIDNWTVSGYDQLDKNKCYLFIANHRDIIMDSAILQIFLNSQNDNICLSCIGDNLLSSQILTDVAKVCNMFTITRNGTPREMVMNSKLVSEYIRTNVVNSTNSVWIAQRNGRTKDGCDKTQQSVLKMLCSSNKSTNIYNSIKELNIVPLTISYEFEPCDNLKAREIILTKKNKKYVKTPEEDFQSMSAGIFDYKSQVHLHFGHVINADIDESLAFSCDNEKFQYVCSLIDKQMYANYHLWPNNYIAYDIVNNTNRFQEFYTDMHKRDFMQHIRKRANIDDVVFFKMKQQLLIIYANPVKAFLEMNKENKF
mgnify:CR=1 FL=1